MKKTFEQWMKEVDTNIKKGVGLCHLDLPDCPYADWYSDGVRPTTAAKRAIKRSFD